MPPSRRRSLSTMGKSRKSRLVRFARTSEPRRVRTHSLWSPERSRNMTARIAAAWPRCSGWVTPLPVRLRKVHRRAGDRYAADRDERGRCGTPLSFDILTPTLRASAARLAERARAENWSHEEKYLAACLQREVSARESHGEEGRIRAARVPARKSLEECDFDQSSPPTKPLAVGAKCSAMTSWPPPKIGRAHV